MILETSQCHYKPHYALEKSVAVLPNFCLAFFPSSLFVLFVLFVVSLVTGLTSSDASTSSSPHTASTCFYSAAEWRDLRTFGCGGALMHRPSCNTGSPSQVTAIEAEIDGARGWAETRRCWPLWLVILEYEHSVGSRPLWWTGAQNNRAYARGSQLASHLARHPPTRNMASRVSQQRHGINWMAGDRKTNTRIVPRRRYARKRRKTRRLFKLHCQCSINVQM